MRPSRSSSIPIPRSPSASASASATRNIDALLPIQRAAPPRAPSRSRFEPTVVRSPERRSRAPSGPKPIVPHHVVARPSFPRPSYLDHSSLRHLLHTEPPFHTIPSRKLDSTQAARNQAFANGLSASPEPDDDNPSSSLPHDSSFTLPTRWSDTDRSTHIAVSADGREALNLGPSAASDKDAASVRTSHPAPAACGIFYYEVEILGREQKSRIAIGFSCKLARFSKLPGHEPNSWSYYGDDGGTFSQEKSNPQPAQCFGGGDIIGCGIDFSTFKIFFTKNGVSLGSFFDNVGRSTSIYPTLGLQHSGDTVRANFGQEPFKYDIDYHVQQQRNHTWNEILATPISRTVQRGHNRPTGLSSLSIASITNDATVLSEEEGRRVLNKLVLSYLVHHGYARTARAFKSRSEGRDKRGTEGPDIDMVNSVNEAEDVESDIELRTDIANVILAGDIDSAIGAIQQHYPTVLEVDKKAFYFKLRFRKFIELILVTAELKKAMKSAQRVSQPTLSQKNARDDWMDEEMSMDVDDDAPRAVNHAGVDEEHDFREINAQYEAALSSAISYGQELTQLFYEEPRPELAPIFKQTFGIVAWEDPLEPGSPMCDIAGHEAKVILAQEINQAILTSQGRPAQPALEMLYRHSSVCITQLGVLGVGAAAFADLPCEP